MVKKNMSMTISQIKQQLIQHGVALPPSSARKDEYERLYYQLVRTQSTKNKIPTSGEFSSDDEIGDDRDIIDSSTNGREVLIEKDEEEEEVRIDPEVLSSVETLTNEEIYGELVELGQNIGPVVETTRSMYVKRLALLKSKLSNITVPVINGSEGEEHHNGHGNIAPTNGFSSDEDENSPPTVIPSRISKSGRRPSPASTTTDDKAEKVPRRIGKPIDTYSPVSSRVTSESGSGSVAHSSNDDAETEILVPKAIVKQRQEKGSGFGIGLALIWGLVVLVFALIVAYFYLNVGTTELDEIDQEIDDLIKQAKEKSPEFT